MSAYACAHFLCVLFSLCFMFMYACNNVDNDAAVDTNQMVYGKSCMLQILLRVAADPTLTEDTLVDLLMNVLADEMPQPPQTQPQPSLGESGESMTGALAGMPFCVPCFGVAGLRKVQYWQTCRARWKHGQT